MGKLKCGIMTGLLLAGLLAGCGKAGTEADAKADLAKIMEIFIGYYDVLDAGKANPAAGLGAGLQYVESKKSGLRDISRRLSRNPNAEALAQDTKMELGEISRKRGQALTAYREYKDDIIAQMNILQQAMSGE